MSPLLVPGVAGLAAAEDLAGCGLDVSLFEKTPFLGGHAVQSRLQGRAGLRQMRCLPGGR